MTSIGSPSETALNRAKWEIYLYVLTWRAGAGSAAAAAAAAVLHLILHAGGSAQRADHSCHRSLREPGAPAHRRYLHLPGRAPEGAAALPCLSNIGYNAICPTSEAQQSEGPSSILIGGLQFLAGFPIAWTLCIWRLNSCKPARCSYMAIIFGSSRPCHQRVHESSSTLWQVPSVPMVISHNVVHAQHSFAGRCRTNSARNFRDMSSFSTLCTSVGGMLWRHVVIIVFVCIWPGWRRRSGVHPQKPRLQAA